MEKKVSNLKLAKTIASEECILNIVVSDFETFDLSSHRQKSDLSKDKTITEI